MDWFAGASKVKCEVCKRGKAIGTREDGKNVCVNHQRVEVEMTNTIGDLIKWKEQQR